MHEPPHNLTEDAPGTNRAVATLQISNTISTWALLSRYQVPVVGGGNISNLPTAQPTFLLLTCTFRRSG